MAAACSSLQHIFENPLPESPTLIDSVSPWSQIKSIDQPSFTELFGELRFKENSHGGGSSPSSTLPISTSSPSPSSSSSSSLSSSFSGTQNNHNHYIGRHKSSDSFSSMNSESLQLCTEGLGFESSDDVEDLKSDDNWQKRHEDPKISKFTTKHSPENLCSEFRRSRVSGGAFPPPISCIGKSGKPWVCFKSFRHDGRFVLKEVRIPTQEFLHACREDGRLKLQFVQPDDEILEEDDEEEDDDD